VSSKDILVSKYSWNCLEPHWEGIEGLKNGEKSTFNLGKLRGLTIAGSSFSSNKITDLGKSHDRLWLPYTRAREGRGELRNLVRASLTFARKTRNQLAVWLARARSNPGSGQTRFALRLREAECAASLRWIKPPISSWVDRVDVSAAPPSPVSSVAFLFLFSWKIITNGGCRDGLLERRTSRILF